MMARSLRVVQQLPLQIGQLLMGEVLFDPSGERAGLCEYLPYPILLLGIVAIGMISFCLGKLNRHKYPRQLSPIQPLCDLAKPLWE